MIILDTNVISEMMKKSPAINLMHWIDKQEVTHLFITVITIAEIAYGINAIPVGNRRSVLETAFNKAISEGFKHRILGFEEHAAHIYGNLMGRRKELGRPMSVLDGQIAAIALSNQATLATRNVRDFTHCDLELINPFN